MWQNTGPKIKHFTLPIFVSSAFSVSKNDEFRKFRKKNQNFERPFTPQTWLRSAWNFGKTRFRWFPTFDFSTPKKFFWWNFRSKKSARNQKSLVLEELRFFERHWQIPCQKLVPVVCFFSLYDPWRRGKRLILCFWVWFRTENDLNLAIFWWHDIMMAT